MNSPLNAAFPRWFVLVASTLAACGPSSSPDVQGTDARIDGNASDVVASDTAPGTDASDAAIPDATSASVVVGPAGGSVSLAGVSLVIPAGALAQDQRITVTTGPAAPMGYQTYSPVYVFGPDGLTFAQPVSVSLPFTGQPNPPVIQWSRATGTGYDALPGTVNGSVMTAQVTHFSQGFVGNLASGHDPRLHRITGGEYSTCALRANGTVACWGGGQSGMLGNGTSGDTAMSPTPVAVTGLTNVISVSAGDFFACALRADDTVACWGLVPPSTVPTVTPVDVPGFTHVVQLEAGPRDVCALEDDGTVWCMGAGGYGELGNGANNDASTPVQVTGITDATLLAMATQCSCVLRADGTVACWGHNWNGELGNGTLTASNVPLTVPGITHPTYLAGGGDGFCTLNADGTLDCWGYLDNSTGTNEEVLSPRRNAFVTDAQSVSILVSYHLGITCALRPGGIALCWQTGNITQLANNGLTGIVEMALGVDAQCFLTGDARIWCMGNNMSGAVGDGTMMSRATPVEVVGF